MPAAPSVRFPPNAEGSFFSDVRATVEAYLAARGLSGFATLSYVLRTITMMGLIVGPYVLILTGVVGGWGALALCVVIGVGMAGVGFGVGHDALHGSVSRNGRVNDLLGITFPMLGASGTLWRLTHNRIHHTFTNLHPHDEDLLVSPLLRLSPSAPRRLFHRWQHLYAWPSYALATINWAFVKDYQYMLRESLGPVIQAPHGFSGWAHLVLGKLFHYGWTIVLPLVVLHPVWWHFLLGYLTLHLTAGLILGVVFQLAHVVEATAFPAVCAPDAQDDAWAVHQMRTTADFARHNRLLTWYVGGLNHQIEHHLFPRVCSVHYPSLGPLVEACAKRHGVPYNDNPTVVAALASHTRMLRAFGRPDAAAAPAATA